MLVVEDFAAASARNPLSTMCRSSVEAGLRRHHRPLREPANRRCCAWSTACWIPPAGASSRRARRHRPEGAGLRDWRAALRHDLPAVQPRRPPRRADQRADGPPQQGLDAQRPCSGCGAPRTGPSRFRRSRMLDIGQPRRAARRQPLRRTAAARRHRPRARAGARDHPRGRADRLARSAQHPGRDGCAAAHQQALRHHRAVQPPFARSRARLLRPPRRHGGRQRRVRRRARARSPTTSRASSTASRPARSWTPTSRPRCPGHTARSPPPDRGGPSRARLRLPNDPHNGAIHVHPPHHPRARR